MSRFVADCRDAPSERGCTLTISGEEEEVLDAAVQHAISAHGHKESPELREMIRGLLKPETTPEWTPAGRIEPLESVVTKH
jgi:predicted small metal-binding protein